MHAVQEQKREYAKLATTKTLSLASLIITAFILACPVASASGESAMYFVHSGHLGTPLKLTDESGTVVWAADYSPFGKASLQVSSVANNVRLAGQYSDLETGLHYNYFRDYDPNIGRYVKSDPIGLRGGYNTYVYVSNNPLRISDPLGLRGMCGIGSRPVPMPGSERDYPDTALCVDDPSEDIFDPKNQYCPTGECKVLDPSTNAVPGDDTCEGKCDSFLAACKLGTVGISAAAVAAELACTASNVGAVGCMVGANAMAALAQAAALAECDRVYKLCMERCSEEESCE